MEKLLWGLLIGFAFMFLAAWGLETAFSRPPPTPVVEALMWAAVFPLYPAAFLERTLNIDGRYYFPIAIATCFVAGEVVAYGVPALRSMIRRMRNKSTTPL